MSLATSLKDALRDQNRHWLVELFEHPDFRTLSERDLSELLAAPSPLLEDELLLEKLCNHPSIHHIEVDSLANLTLLMLRLGKRAYIDFCLSFAKFRLIQGQHAENIAREALYFQGRKRIEELQKNSSIRQFFKDHPALQIECSLRNDDKEWLNDLLAEKPDITPVFTKILKWTLVSHDKKILSLSLSMVKIDPQLENSLLKVIEEASLGYNREEWIDDYHTFVLLLATHKDYPKYTALLLSWMLGTALQKEDRGLILHLFQHPSYDALDPAQLYFLIDISFDCKDDSFLKHLVHHPQFHSLSELHLGLMMEKGAQKACAQVIELAIRHQHF
ncbi:MAG: hypothetical protein LW832_01850, partial [Parachlamydia sp.]|nr:hypothetical protein [Parachlamydia sp.]